MDDREIREYLGHVLQAKRCLDSAGVPELGRSFVIPQKQYESIAEYLHEDIQKLYGFELRVV